MPRLGVAVLALALLALTSTAYALEFRGPMTYEFRGACFGSADCDPPFAVSGIADAVARLIGVDEIQLEAIDGAFSFRAEIFVAASGNAEDGLGTTIDFGFFDVEAGGPIGLAGLPHAIVINLGVNPTTVYESGDTLWQFAGEITGVLTRVRAVPEPGVLALLALGVATVAAVGRKRWVSRPEP